MYLFVHVTVRNDDKQVRSIRPFKLIDENGAAYEATSKGWTNDEAIGVVENFNPGVQKTGVLIFDIPQHHTYNLKVSGGYWSEGEAMVGRSPK
jgi:hypothetical protein